MPTSKEKKRLYDIGYGKIYREQHQQQRKAYYDLHKEYFKEHYKVFLKQNPGYSKKHTEAHLKRRRNWINQFKNKPCTDCQGWFEPCQMDFDHLNPKEKLFQIGQRITRPIKDILLEMAKCELVCSNCHKLRTAQRRIRCHTI